MEHVQSSLGNNGVVLDIAGDDGELRGKLPIGRAKVEWRKRGLRQATPGVVLTLPALIKYLEGTAEADTSTPARGAKAQAGAKNVRAPGRSRRPWGSEQDGLF